MAAEIFTAISALRMVLDSETDADSPDNETTFAAIRVAIESLFLILLGTGVTGTVTGIAEEVLTDTTNFVDSAHLEHTLLMTSGDAKGNMYTIDSNTTSALTCTGDTMDSDGVAIDDTYVILYDCKTNTGHTHDAKNAKSVDLADDSVNSEHYAAGSIDEEHMSDNSVDQNALKCSFGSGTTTSESGEAISINAEYSFLYQLKNADANNTYVGWNKTGTVATYAGVNSGTTYGLDVWISTHSTLATGTIGWYYVTASGETHWVFILKDKATGKYLSMWQAPDHPCFGSGGKPLLKPHPFGSYDPAKHEIIVVNPVMEEVRDIMLGMPVESEEEADKDFLEVVNQYYQIDETVSPAWPKMLVTTGLPKTKDGYPVDWRFIPQRDSSGNHVIIEPVKKVIPEMFKTARLKLIT